MIPAAPFAAGIAVALNDGPWWVKLCARTPGLRRFAWRYIQGEIAKQLQALAAAVEAGDVVMLEQPRVSRGTPAALPSAHIPPESEAAGPP